MAPVRIVEVESHTVTRYHAADDIADAQRNRVVEAGTGTDSDAVIVDAGEMVAAVLLDPDLGA